jgi:glycosyltransferase involved in cell wall biosynthesis
MDLYQHKNDRPIVTVVTPSYNQGRFIRETIDSVLAQDYPHVEYLVVDGGSSDETLDILRSYGSRLSWISEPDTGQAHAINKGWKQAKGDIVAWLNSDDVYLPGAVRKAVDAFARHQDAGVIYGEAFYIDEVGHRIKRYPTEGFSHQRLIDLCYICQPAAFFRRSVVKDLGFLNDQLHYCMDYELLIRISTRYPLVHIVDDLALSRLHGECKTVKSRLKALTEVVGMLHRHYGFVAPSWLGGYVRAVLERRLNRPQPRGAVFLLGVVTLGVREFFRYNRKLPFSEYGRWRRGLVKGFKKLWTGISDHP